jgi:V/A-type H+-transporting ATPase subunit D
MREIAPTRSAFLELQAERRSMEEAYRFLDEKRLILAAEMLRELKRYEKVLGEFRQTFAQARAALQAAVMRHGLEGLEVYPPIFSEQADLEITPRSVLGVLVQKVETPVSHFEAIPAPNPSPEAEHCRKAFIDVIPLAADLACTSGNLERLRKEYRRTARRACALEDVLLPEIDKSLAEIQLSLEELDQEDAVRVRFCR